MTNVSIITALLAGVLSFVSPCVLPLIPAYISYISGVSLQDMQSGEVSSKKIIINSIAFVLGFSTVFILLGASASLIGKVLARHMNTFKLIAGIIIIIFGLHTAGIIRIKFLNYEKKVQVKRSNSATLIGAYVIGIAFAAGWTPCVGPILGAILAEASTYTTMSKGIILLTVYSLGLGIPFILTAWAINKFFAAFKQIRKYFHAIEIISGILLIIVGLLLIFMKGLHF
jgi:cytochrome c-type biogenesis protein